jgi:hypothetical protein
MADFSAISDRLEAIAEERGDEAILALGKALRALEADLADALDEKAVWRYEDLDELLRVVQDAIGRSGLHDVAEVFGQAALEYAKKVDAGIDALSFGSSESNMLYAAIQAKYAGWQETVEGKFLSWLRAIMAQQVLTGVDAKTLYKEALDYLEGSLRSYASTYIETALQQSIRDTWAVAGQALKATYYRYAGPPLIPTSHEFCIEHYGETRPLKEWEEMDNGTDLPVVWSCGGWNCRHYLEPVPGEAGRLEEE